MTTDAQPPVLEWRWRIKWGGRWRKDTIWRTEAEVRREHPEAERIDGTERVRAPLVPLDSMYRPAVVMDPAIELAWRGRTTPGKPPKG